MLNMCVSVFFEDSTDILIMMDSSASVGAENFKLTQNFTDKLARRFLFADKKTGVQVRVGVGQYSDSAVIETDFSTNYTVLANEIADAKFQNAGTQVIEALNFAISRFRGGRNRKKKLLLFSDGRSQNMSPRQLQDVVKEVDQQGIELFVLAVENQLNQYNLQILASRGRTDDNIYATRHLFRAPNYLSFIRGVFYQTVSRRISLK